MRKPLSLLVVCLGASAVYWTSGQTSLAAAFPGDPNQAAWDLFGRINQPVPDEMDSLWEDWALADDLFPVAPAGPLWPSGHRVKKLETLDQETSLLELASRTSNLMRRRPAIDPTPNSEVHVNCPTFSYVVSEGLWNTNGLHDRAAAIVAGTKKPIVLPDDSILVKAKWRKWNQEDVTRYHWATDANGAKWLLIGLHVTSRLQPTWFWATWEHVDNQGRPPSIDTFGFLKGSSTPSTGLSQMFQNYHLRAEWSFYRLDGAQTDYNSPKILGNSTLETNFMETSSCMACHFRSGRYGGDFYPSVFDSQGHGYTGTPQSSWIPPGNPPYMPMDFFWSMAVRANYYGHPFTAQPPPDCKTIQ